MTSNPKILALAFLGGIVPSLLWLWFWLKEDEHPEPKSLLSILFIMGMLAVIVVLPIQRFIQGEISSYEGELFLWASVEEIMKYLAVLVVASGINTGEDPVDWPIYLITSALGFAALENMLFLVKPFAVEGGVVALLTGQLRFLGSTLLHTVASGTIGLAIGISFYMAEWKKEWLIFFGFATAIGLHTAFNFFIMRNNGSDFLKVFAFLWVATIIVMLIFEKVRRMSETKLLLK